MKRPTVWDTREPKWWESVGAFCDAHGLSEQATEALFDIVHEAIQEDASAVLGSRGGEKGGRARAEAMTKSERIASASLAAKARWAMARAK